MIAARSAVHSAARAAAAAAGRLPCGRERGGRGGQGQVRVAGASLAEGRAALVRAVRDGRGENEAGCHSGARRSIAGGARRHLGRGGLLQ